MIVASETAEISYLNDGSGLMLQPCDTEGNYVVIVISDEISELCTSTQSIILFNEDTLSFSYRMYSTPYHTRNDADPWFLWRSTVIAVEDRSGDYSGTYGVRLHVYNYRLLCSEGENKDLLDPIPPSAAKPAIHFQNYMNYHHAVYGPSQESPTTTGWLHVRGNDTFLHLIDDGDFLDSMPCVRVDTLCFEDGVSPPEGTEDFTLRKASSQIGSLNMC